MPDRSCRNLEVVAVLIRLALSDLETIVGLDAIFQQPEPIVELHCEERWDGMKDTRKTRKG